MSDKILEKNGTNITNIDGARFNRFCAGYKDGIIKKSYKECQISLISSNVINIAKGELLISGFRIIMNEVQISFPTLPSTPNRYQIVGKLELDHENNPSFTKEVRLITSLIQEDLFDESLNSRIYEVEIARFTADKNGLSDIVRTFDLVASSYIDNNGLINIGTVETNIIDETLSPEVDIDVVYVEEKQKYFTNFKFQLPDGIRYIEKISTEGLKDTYLIKFTSGKESTFNVKNGDSVELRVFEGIIQWKSYYGETWQDIVALGELVSVDQNLDNLSTNAISNSAVYQAVEELKDQMEEDNMESVLDLIHFGNENTVIPASSKTSTINGIEYKRYMQSSLIKEFSSSDEMKQYLNDKYKYCNAMRFAMYGGYSYALSNGATITTEAWSNALRYMIDLKLKYSYENGDKYVLVFEGEFPNVFPIKMANNSGSLYTPTDLYMRTKITINQTSMNITFDIEIYFNTNSGDTNSNNFFQFDIYSLSRF